MLATPTVSLTGFELLARVLFRTEAAAYEIYENKMHTEYSGFTVTKVADRLKGKISFTLGGEIWWANGNFGEKTGILVSKREF